VCVGCVGGGGGGVCVCVCGGVGVGVGGWGGVGGRERKKGGWMKGCIEIGAL
jgi:hypothetical protein